MTSPSRVRTLAGTGLGSGSSLSWRFGLVGVLRVLDGPQEGSRTAGVLPS